MLQNVGALVSPCCVVVGSLQSNNMMAWWQYGTRVFSISEWPVLVVRAGLYVPTTIRRLYWNRETGRGGGGGARCTDLAAPLPTEFRCVEIRVRTETIEISSCQSL